MKLISKEVSRAEPEYMNMHPPPPISVLATALSVFVGYEELLRPRFVLSVCDIVITQTSASIISHILLDLIQ